MSGQDTTLNTTVTQAGQIGSALLGLLPILGIPVAGPLTTALVTAVAVAPEIVKIIAGDIAMFQNGQITAQQLLDKFTATQGAFEAAAKRWEGAGPTGGVTANSSTG